MNVPESNLVTQFFNNAKRIYQDALRGRDALSIRGVDSESAQAACGRIAEKLCDVERVGAAMAELIEAAKFAVAADSSDPLGIQRAQLRLKVAIAHIGGGQ